LYAEHSVGQRLYYDLGIDEIWVLDLAIEERKTHIEETRQKIDKMKAERMKAELNLPVL
jgi:hypothetical protein